MSVSFVEFFFQARCRFKTQVSIDLVVFDDYYFPNGTFFVSVLIPITRYLQSFGTACFARVLPQINCIIDTIRKQGYVKTIILTVKQRE